MPNLVSLAFILAENNALIQTESLTDIRTNKETWLNQLDKYSWARMFVFYIVCHVFFYLLHTFKQGWYTH